ncbi:MAG: ABC transporter substrate-binding protein [Coriobacteriaceae bacterium]|nr:ABC transporter substrate-binding protein [Coriobacteriaceae bacterium]
MGNISRKQFITLGAASAAALGLAGCGGGASSSDTGGAGTDGHSGNVYWLNFKPELDETAQALAKAYMEKYPNVKVKVQTAASGTYEQTLTSEMDKTDAPTLFNIGTTAGVKEWGPSAMDLSGTDIEKALSTTDYSYKDDKGRLVCAGLCYETYGIVVNSDLVEKAGHSVSDIKDFDSLRAVAEDIHKNAATLGFDAFAATDLDDSSSWRVTGHLANLEYYYEERDEGGWDATPATIKGTYLPNYKKIFDLAINNSAEDPTTLSTGGHDPSTEFTSGKAAFFLTGSWDYATIAAAQKNTTMIPYYCGVAGEEKAGLNSGTENRLAINDSASDKDKRATMDFWLWLVTDPEASRQMVDQLGVLPYTDAAKGDNGYLNKAEELSKAGNYTMDWATNYQPNVDQYRKGLVSALNAYTADQSDANWETFKTAFVDGWAQNYKVENA